MTTAERLLKVNEYVDKAESLNKELGQTLYGSDEKSTLDTNVHQAISDFNSVKDKFVENGVEVSDDTKTSEYADKVDEVYSVGKSDGYTEGHEAGYTKGKTDGHAEGVEYGYNSGYAEGASAGYAEGIDVGKAEGFTEGKAEGFEEGKKSEYDAFWDEYQQNGSRTYYKNGFAGICWNNNTFKPKYDIQVKEGYMMFRECKIVELYDVLEALNINLTFLTNCDPQYMFSLMANTTRLGVLDFSATIRQLWYIFSQSPVVTVERFISAKTTVYSSETFAHCYSLKNITFEGEIGNSINFQWSPLSPDSMKSVITHLVNYIGTDKEGTYSVTFTDKCWTALEADSAAPDGGTWREYVEYTLGWQT